MAGEVRIPGHPAGKTVRGATAIDLGRSAQHADGKTGGGDVVEDAGDQIAPRQARVGDTGHPLRLPRDAAARR